MSSKKPNVVVSLSGGLDSSTLLLRCLSEYKNVTAISFDYGQKHRVELERAQSLVDYLREQGFDITYSTIELKGLSDLLVSGLVDNNSMEMKRGHYAHSNALTTVVPNRNAIFASITYAVALSIVKRTGEYCQIALGTHMGDFDNKKQSGIYPDCSEEFKVILERAFKVGNWDSEKVDYYAPYNSTDKTGVLEDGITCCKELNLDYKEIYKRTNTSYSPIKLEDGSWVSDYQSGSSIERIVSFIKLGLEDPVQYAEDDGTFISWEFARDHALKIEEEFKKDNPDF